MKEIINFAQKLRFKKKGLIRNCLKIYVKYGKEKNDGTTFDNTK